jgi:hypothetical protein
MSQQPLDYAESPSRTSVIATRVTRRLRRILPYLIVALICYVGSYVCLSAFGRFVPAVIGAGANGTSVKWYRWAPAGFVSGYHHHWGLFYFYLPLYLVDCNYWHRDAEAYSGKYPTSRPATAAEWAEWKR